MRPSTELNLMAKYSYVFGVQNLAVLTSASLLSSGMIGLTVGERPFQSSGLRT